MSSPSARSKAASSRRRGFEGALARELKAARKAARAAGTIVLRHWHRRDFQVDSKGHDNPVTSADFEADSALREILAGAFPDYGWLSEETADDGDRLKRERVWIVDPLDGTKEFIQGVPEFVVAIALAEKGEPILGVTYNPVKQELYWAARAMGCHRDGRKVSVTATHVLSDAAVLASRSETARGEWRAYEKRVKVSAVGSVAYKLALVAAGAADATFTLLPKSEWDVASGAALLLEAGGRITDVEGHEIRFNQPKVRVKGLIASNGHLHDAIERMLWRGGKA